ncbi:MAG: GNAT family N-acetyltransferase [Candidatus Hodarchaeales archaeon]
MAEVVIKKYESKYRNDVIRICHETGYMGQPAHGRFDDVYLFGLLFCVYYIDYEPENCFVAVDTSKDKAIGYVLSSLDSKSQEEAYRQKILPKLYRRAFLWTMWRHPNTFRVLWHFKTIFEKSPRIPDESELLKPYPAHLHIDILADYQRQGIGTRLIEKLENHLRNFHIKGVHLGTTSYNNSAISFYYKQGFKLLYEGPEGFGMWPDSPDAKSMLFGKIIG